MATYRTKQQQAVLDCLSRRPESPLSAMELARQCGFKTAWAYHGRDAVEFPL